MKKNMLLMSGALAAIFVFPFVVFAGSCGCCGQDSCQQQELSCGAVSYDGKTVAAPVAKAVEVGNKICPVMGVPIAEETKVTFEHEGKIYNFCCSGCLVAFKNDPATYIKKIPAEFHLKK